MKEKYEVLKQTRPGGISNGFTVHFYRIAGRVIAMLFALSGISLLFNLGIQKNVMKLFDLNNSDRQSAGIWFIAFAVLFQGVSSLARTLINRNKYILALEDVVEKQIKEEKGELVG
jgi:hypothetical protein